MLLAFPVKIRCVFAVVEPGIQEPVQENLSGRMSNVYDFCLSLNVLNVRHLSQRMELASI